MQTATLGSVPCLPCDIGTVLSQQPIACQARCGGEHRPKLQAKFRELEDSGTVRGAAIRIAVASIKMSVGGFDDALKLGEHLALMAKRRSRRCGVAALRRCGVAAALPDRRFDCLLPVIGL
jgi:hypothetical protein